MNGDLHYQLFKSDRQHRLQMAGQQRLMHPTHARKRLRITRVYGPLLYHLGGWMMAYGIALRTRYGEISTSVQELREREKLVLSLRDDLP
ncbi:MAG: hypothetical protein K8L99_21995 [Anaerolineae bacterium]|nr:hypothetical protein [Anaerolineae bacterium]